ncbi:MAG: TIGR01212 family radical SAM protein [Ruminococcus sp.]
MKHYYSLNEFYRNKYGKKVYKLSINGGMTCPNRDGKINTGGCIFCSSGGSGEFASSPLLSITQQLEIAKSKINSKTKDNAYIAYFQPYSNTYGNIEYLEKIYSEAIYNNEIVGLSIATRPDCLGNNILNLLDKMNKVKPVCVELGLQTIHKSTSDYIRRGYELEVYDEAVKNLHNIGIEVVTHLIIGLPNESYEMIYESVKYVGKVTDGIKLQLLHVIKGTDLAEDYYNKKFEVLSLEHYTDIICNSIELLPENVVVHRITGDGDKRTLITPLWSGDKKKTLNYINGEMNRRNIIQGSKLK